MSVGEDAATILDDFIHEIANLPAEIQHLLEEIQAKDVRVREHQQQIDQRDVVLQKHVKQIGGHVKHPKEEQMMKSARDHYDVAQKLQDEKLAMSQKSCSLLDKHVKRLDLRIRNLQNDPTSTALLDDLPSTLHATEANLVDPISTRGSGVSTPLAHLPFNLTDRGPGGPNIANAAMARMAQSNAQAARGAPQAPMAGMAPHPLIGSTGAAGSRSGREGSAAAADRKRKLHLGNLAAPSSALARGASAGPGTPKAGTPVSRQGSLGPRTKKTTMKKAGASGPDHPLRKKMNKGGISKKVARRVKGGHRASPSTTGEDGSDASGDEEDDASQSMIDAGDEDDELNDAGYEEDEGDTKPYCICQKPSHGDMIACDNLRCKFEWFHYECVNLKSEPKGIWLCPECRKMPPSQVKIDRKSK